MKKLFLSLPLIIIILFYFEVLSKSYGEDILTYKFVIFSVVISSLFINSEITNVARKLNAEKCVVTGVILSFCIFIVNLICYRYFQESLEYLPEMLAFMATIVIYALTLSLLPNLLKNKSKIKTEA